MKKYIPIEEIDLVKLKRDIEKEKGKFTLRALGALLDISHVALFKKLSGEYPLRKSELQRLAARLGEDPETYLKNSHADSA